MTTDFVKSRNVDNSSKQFDKLKITFAIASDFNGLGGLELMLIQYYKYADKSKYDINIVCIDKGNKNKTMRCLEENGVPKDKITTIEDVDTKFAFLLRSRLGRKLFYGLARPLSSFLLYISGTRNKLGKKLNSQVVYLFNNELNFYFRKFNGLVIGHNGMWVINERSISFHLIKNKFLWRRIDGMRLFPQYRKYVNKINRRYSFVLQNGVDTGLYNLPTDTKNWKEVRFLFVGRLDYGKGFDLLISAFSSVPKDFNFKLSVVGGGELESIIPSEDERIKYYGRKSSIDLANIYKSSDILILPSRWDPYPLVILESLACGTGVIVTERLKGAYDDFENINVLNYTPLDTESIKKNMYEMAIKIEEIRNSYPIIREIIKEKHDVAKVSTLFFNELYRNYLSYREKGYFN